MFFLYASQAKRIFVLQRLKNRNKNYFKSQVFLFVFFTLFSGVFYFDFKKFSLLLTFSYDMSYNFN